ncbi:MAG: hypothetical protein FJX56_04535 [Alphaproteobacteria bacterium]|nr:hypothetical protein [Alphaproteobacteria bacterium]
MRLAYRAAAAALATALIVGAPVAVAQDTDREALEREYDALFQQLFRKPSDLDATFKFAEMAVRLGNYEAAISALERMLLYNPNLPRVRLELGVLYFRIGSYAMSRIYLDRAIADPGVPDDVRKRVELFLAEIDRLLLPSELDGTLTGGVRWQSNANAGPDSPAVRALGLAVALGDQFTQSSDANVFLGGGLRHRYEFRNEMGVALETNGFAFGTRHRDESNLHLFLISIDSGPRAPFVPEWFEKATVRPYVMIDQIWLGDEHHQQSAGVGVNLTKAYEINLTTEVDLRLRALDFDSSLSRPDNSEQSGYEEQVRLAFNYAHTGRWLIGGFARLTAHHADEDRHTNSEMEFGLNTAVLYAAPVTIGPSTDPWTTQVSATRSYANYDEPDPLVEPAVSRRDQGTTVTLLTAVPVNDAWTVVATLQRTVNNANIPNFELTNNLVSLAASYRF